MKKIVMFLGALALVAAMSTVALAAGDKCQERKADLIDISPKKDIMYTIQDCDAAKVEAAAAIAKKGL